MKKGFIIVTGIAVVVVMGFVWRMDVVKNILLVYYQNIQVLDGSKEIATDSKHKDGSYRLLYFMSFDRITSARKTWIGKICSDSIERRNPKYRNLREASDEYFSQYP